MKYVGIVIQGMVLDSAAVTVGEDSQAVLQSAEGEAHSRNQKIEMEEGYTAIVLSLPDES
jgi:hypothetical protein